MREIQIVVTVCEPFHLMAMAVMLSVLYFLLCLRALRSSAVVARHGREEVNNFMSTVLEVLRNHPTMPSFSARPLGRGRPTCCYMTGSSGGSAAHLATGPRLAVRPRGLLLLQSEWEGRGGEGVVYSTHLY